MQSDLCQTLLTLPLEEVYLWGTLHPDNDCTEELLNYVKVNRFELSLSETITLLDKGILLTHVQHDFLQKALFLRQKANIYQYHSHYHQSLEASDEAIRIYETYNKPKDSARAKVIKIHVLGVLEKFDEALALGEKLLDVFDEYADTREFAYTVSNVARVYLHSWQPREALRWLAKCQLAFDRLQEPLTMAKAWHNMGSATRRLGQFTRAEQHYNQALKVYREKNNKANIFFVMLNLSEIARHRGAYADAFPHLQEAQQMLTALNESADVGYFYKEKGVLYRELNEHKTAQGLFERALDYFQKEDERGMDRLEVLVELALLFAKHKQWDDALEHLQQAIAQAKRAKAPLFEAIIQLKQASFSLQKGDKASAHTLAERTRKAFIGLPIRLAQAELIIADSTEDISIARHLYERILATVGQSFLPIQSRCLTGLGDLAKQDTQWVEAEQYYRQALALVHLMRQSLPTYQYHAGFMVDKQALLDKILMVLQAQNGRLLDLLQQVEQNKSYVLAELLAEQTTDSIMSPTTQQQMQRRITLQRTFNHHFQQLENAPQLDGQQSAEIVSRHDTYQQGHVQALQHELQELDAQIAQNQDVSKAWRDGLTASTTHIHDLLDENTLFISYYSIGETLYALTASHQEGSIQTYQLPLSLSALHTIWKKSVHRLDNVHPYRPLHQQIQRVQKYLQQIWEGLLSPLEAHLDNYQTLLISPCKELFKLPFSALFNGSHYLIETHIIQLIPSLPILTQCRQRTLSTHPPLLFGYPGDVVVPHYLQGVVDEIQGIQELIPQSTVIPPEEATVAQLLDHFSHHHMLIHLAGHMVYDDQRPLASGLPLLDDEWLLASDLFKKYGSLGGALVVLSGCNSARGQIRGGEVLGLTSSFLYAGAIGIVAGLWPIDDKATAQWMLQFYQTLIEGHDVTTAIAQTQRWCIQHDAYAHPHYWASFSLMGDNRQIPLAKML